MTIKSRRINSNYKRKRAEDIMRLREEGLSFNQIAKALNYEITSQRIQAIAKHYKERVIPQKTQDQIKLFDSEKKINSNS